MVEQRCGSTHFQPYHKEEGFWSISAPVDIGLLLEKKTPATIEKKPGQIA
jgi:hypothetical protein